MSKGRRELALCVACRRECHSAHVGGLVFLLETGSLLLFTAVYVRLAGLQTSRGTPILASHWGYTGNTDTCAALSDFCAGCGVSLISGLQVFMLYSLSLLLHPKRESFFLIAVNFKTC